MSNTIKGSNIPFFNLSKETLKLIIDLLEGDDIEVFLTALYDYIYEGIEPNFNTKILKSVWNNVLSVIERKAQSYFNKVEANKENGKKGGRPKKNNQDIQPNTEFEISDFKAFSTPNDTIPPSDTESVSNGQEIGENGTYSTQEIAFILEQYNIPENAPSNDLLIQDKYLTISRKFGISMGQLQTVQQQRFNTRLKITG